MAGSHASGALAVKGKKSSRLSALGMWAELAVGSACPRLFRVGGGDLLKAFAGGRAGRRPLPPSRREQDVSRRGGQGEEKPRAAAPRPTSGTRPSPPQMPPPEPQDAHRAARGVHRVEPRRPGPLSRVLRDPRAPAPAQGPGPLMPSAPFWRSPGLGKSAPRLEARPAPGFEDRRICGRASLPRGPNSESKTPSWSHLGTGPRASA